MSRQGATQMRRLIRPNRSVTARSGCVAFVFCYLLSLIV